MELYQAEWCPHSHRVRQRLTELRLDFLAIQVPAEPEQRAAMRRAVSDDSIPVLVDRDEIVHGDEAILAYLERAYRDAPDAERHCAKAREEVPGFAEAAAAEAPPERPAVVGRPSTPPP
jgi:glutathione S-transferase